MSAILQNEKLSQSVRMVMGAVKSVWVWSRDRLWPVYTTAVVLSVFQMLASASEKQILADHYYGDIVRNNGKVLNEDRSELVSESKKYFQEEVTLAIKERVWNMPPDVFRRTYEGRLGEQ